MPHDEMTGGALPPLAELLRLAAEREASDLFLQEGEPPQLRVAGRMRELDFPAVGSGEVVPLLGPHVPDFAGRRFEETGSSDFAVEEAGFRWRAALFQQRGAAGANLRRIPHEVPSVDEWGLPEVLKAVYDLSQGLVLVTGPAGAGKSSTLAALLRGILEARPAHLVTIEDPIEYLLPKGMGLVTQREVGLDTPSFEDGLRAAVRQQPDVLLVGEVRDRETSDAVLRASETGSLVFATLHTRSAPETVGRFLEFFPDSERQRVLGQLSRNLQAVFTQILVQRADGAGLTAAVEVLRASPPVKQRLAEGDVWGLAEEIETSVAFHRMQTMNQSLAALVLLGAVTREEALRRSPAPDDLDLLVRNSRLVPGEDDPMGASFCDYSKVHDLQELKRLHDEELASHRETVDGLEGRIGGLEKALEETGRELRREREKLRGLEEEWTLMRTALRERRQVLERDVDRLQRQAARLREITDPRPWWKRLLSGGGNS